MVVKQHFLNSFLNPKSVAIVGASRNPGTMVFNLAANLVNLGFSGAIYPVNPGSDEILGIKAYPNLKSIEGDIDLVVSAVPTHATLDIVKECIAKKVKGLVLVTGGFSETGEQGQKMQDEIAHLLKKSGIRTMGPNALSPINTSNNFTISFFPLKQKLRQGNVSFIFQSGFYDPRLKWILWDHNLGVSKIIDLGNKMDINEVDALEYLAEDPDTKVIAMHLETAKGAGVKFMRLLKDISKKKPVVVLKSGRTAAGAKVAASHTGSMATETDAIFDAMLKQAGAIRAQNMEEFFDFAKAFSFLDLPSGNKTIIASWSGGENVMATDICQREGLSLAKPGKATYDKIKAIFPPWEIPLNPFDIAVCFQLNGSGKIFDVLLGNMVEDANVDCLAVQILPSAYAPMSQDVYKHFLSSRKKGKPIVTSMPIQDSPEEDAIVEMLESNHIPVYSSVERAIKALAVLYRYKAMRDSAD